MVAIQFSAVNGLFVATINNDEDMNGPSLVSARRFESRDPRAIRTESDLVRFGLGLNTASFSQCKRLTVATIVEKRLEIARWDLDECERRGSWWLGRPDRSSVPEDVLDLLSVQGRGTAVIWQDLDRLGASGGSDQSRAIETALNDSADYLAMAFHRFLSGEMVKGFDIRINGRPLPKLDPFLVGHVRGQALHSKSFQIDGQRVTVSPFVLPFPSRLQASELDRAGGRDSLKVGHHAG